MTPDRLRPTDVSVAVVQNRLIDGPERARMEIIRARANALRPEGTIKYRWINTLTDNPGELRRQAFLQEGHVAAIILGSSDGDHTEKTNPTQQRFDALGFPIVKNLMKSDLPVFGECYADQAMARAIGGEVVRDTSRMEGATHTLKLNRIGVSHVAYQGMSTEQLRIFGHKDSAFPPEDQVVILGESLRKDGTTRDPNSVWASLDGKKLAEQGHPSIEEAAVAEAGFSSVRDPSLAPYRRTGEYIDTPGAGLVIVNFMLAAASGTREWFVDSEAA